jgi:hypothetical protein
LLTCLIVFAACNADLSFDEIHMQALKDENNQERDVGLSSELER